MPGIAVTLCLRLQLAYGRSQEDHGGVYVLYDQLGQARCASS
jgi:hypothetical protein